MIAAIVVKGKSTGSQFMFKSKFTVLKMMMMNLYLNTKVCKIKTHEFTLVCITKFFFFLKKFDQRTHPTYNTMTTTNTKHYLQTQCTN